MELFGAVGTTDAASEKISGAGGRLGEAVGEIGARVAPGSLVGLDEGPKEGLFVGS